MVDVALQGEGRFEAGGGSTARKVLQRLRLGDIAFPWPDARRAALCGPDASSSGVIISLIDGVAAGAPERSASASLVDERWNPVTESSARSRRSTARMVTSLIAMLIAVPIGLLIAVFLTELCPTVAAPPDRHRHRAARRHSRRSSTASGACSCSRRSCRTRCSRS